MERNQIRDGAEVYGADGEKVGKIVNVRDDHVVVEKGFFFPHDYYVPLSAIARGDGDDVYLTLTRDEALEQGWDVPPAGSDEWGGGIHGMAAVAGATTGIAETTGLGAITEGGGADVVPDEFGEYVEGDE